MENGVGIVKLMGRYSGKCVKVCSNDKIVTFLPGDLLATYVADSLAFKSLMSFPFTCNFCFTGFIAMFATLASRDVVRS